MLDVVFPVGGREVQVQGGGEVDVGGVEGEEEEREELVDLREEDLLFLVIFCSVLA